MEQPQRFIQPGTHHKVCKLHKTFYGFTQSPRVLYERIYSFLLTSTFKNNVTNTNVYILTQDNRFMILTLYVDDVILISNDVDDC
jgi:hypothetical protein